MSARLPDVRWRPWLSRWRNERDLLRMSARLLDQCDICGNRDLQKVLDLGSSPPTCAMPPVGRRPAVEEHHPLELLYCAKCQLGLMSVVVSNTVSFPPEYPYSSGNSRALHENFEDLANQAMGCLDGSEDLVVDIGANDGTLLSKFDGYHRMVGVEPTEQGVTIEGEWYQGFFTEALAKDIRAIEGPAKVVTATNVLAHVDHLSDVMRGIVHLLDDDGVLIAENHDLASVVEGRQWDTVYHEHLRFFSPHSFVRLLKDYGLHVRSIKPIPTHGGSFRVVAGRNFPAELAPRQKYDFAGLAETAVETRRQLRSALSYGSCFGIGATARATTIINYCGLDVQDIECVCEVEGSDKIGHYIPGTSIPVVDESRLFEELPDMAVLFSWHLADHIIPKLRERGFTNPIVVPLPTVRHDYHFHPPGPAWEPPSPIHSLAVRKSGMETDETKLR